MSASKTNNPIRLPGNEDQARILRNVNVNQDNKASGGLQGEASSSKDKATDTSWGTDELLGTNIDQEGHPVPDPMTETGAPAQHQHEQQDGDVYQAMTEDFD